MRETGRIIRCMAMGNINGKMAALIKENTQMIRNKERAFTNGMTEEFMMADGIMVNSIEWATSLTHLVQPKQANGKRDR
jgi:hypothetical protein